MPGEKIDPGGNAVLTKGLYGGYFDSVPTGVKPREHENPASSFGRQKFFYSAVKELSSTNWLFAKYWQPGGPVDTITSELSYGLDEASRMGQISKQEKEKLGQDYETRAIAYICMEGMLSSVRHSDGAVFNIVDKMPSELVMAEYGWNPEKSKMISSDPAVAWPLYWIREQAEKGTLFRYLKDGDETLFKKKIGTHTEQTME